MTMINLLVGVAVRDIEAATAWYGQLIGWPPHPHPVPKLVEWQFEEGGWLQLFEDANRAGSSSVTFFEDSLDERVAQLKRLEIEIGQTSDTDRFKTAIIADPDGNRLIFAEVLSAGKRAIS